MYTADQGKNPTGSARPEIRRSTNVDVHVSGACGDASSTSLIGATDVRTAEPYFLGLGRAMVSLGPLTDNTYCTYKCKFCYVNGPYTKYARRSPAEILDWLCDKRDQYNIIYISGDTDSFAPPRTTTALTLLDKLVDLEVDVLFTTRYVFSTAEREVLRSINAKYVKSRKLLIPCVSISQLTHPGLEPPPIPTPYERLNQLRWLHEIGAKALLTVRPFMPYISAEEYAEIVRLGAPYSEAILGGDLYSDEQGVIDDTIRQAMGVPVTSLNGDYVSKHRLDSTNDSIEWLITRHPRAEALAEKAADEASRSFFMRSNRAVDFLRAVSE